MFHVEHCLFLVIYQKYGNLVCSINDTFAKYFAYFACLALLYCLQFTLIMRERQQKILEHVRNVGIASFHDLAGMFGVSSFTIRRDVDYLAQSRLLVRIKGGAQRIETASQFHEPGLPSRLQVNLKQNHFQIYLAI